MPVSSADKVADYIIQFFQEHGDLITNLKLQKLLYYSQGWYLAIYGEALFGDEIQAWVHGPVVPTVYNKFRSFGCAPIITNSSNFPLPLNIEEHLDEVLDVYGDYHAFVLEQMSHSTFPWLNARGDIPIDTPSSVQISIEDMRFHFKQKKDASGQEKKYCR